MVAKTTSGLSSIRGIGVDIVDVRRFTAAMDRSPRLAERLFVPAEIAPDLSGRRLMNFLAARFAAKEVVAKALGAPSNLSWHDCQVLTADSGQPFIHVSDSVRLASDARGITQWHLSMTHDADLAIAYVVAEGAHDA